MRIPQQVTERVKEAPTHALRAVFSGIGQVLLVADRIKNRAAEPNRDQPGAVRPGNQSAQDTAAQDTAAPEKDPTRWRSLDETGNVRLLSEEAPEDEIASPAGGPGGETETAAGPAPAAGPDDEAAQAETAAESAAGPAAQAAQAETAAEPAAEPAAQAARAEPAVPAQADLPVPNYDTLTVASLRARMRNLDRSQVSVLLDYEKANAGRAAVLTMFERRIARLESGEA